eukprot:SAG11_NODE_2748_length_3012_cov_1.546859_2_plen_114_part_00
MRKPRESGKVSIGIREVEAESVLGALTGTDNVITVESDLFKTGQVRFVRFARRHLLESSETIAMLCYAFSPQELVLHGPGSGLDRTVAAVKADLYLCAMEMPRHHVVGASHLF